MQYTKIEINDPKFKWNAGVIHKPVIVQLSYYVKYFMDQQAIDNLPEPEKYSSKFLHYTKDWVAPSNTLYVNVPKTEEDQHNNLRDLAPFLRLYYYTTVETHSSYLSLQEGELTDIGSKVALNREEKILLVSYTSCVTDNSFTVVGKYTRRPIHHITEASRELSMALYDQQGKQIEFDKDTDMSNVVVLSYRPDLPDRIYDAFRIKEGNLWKDLENKDTIVSALQILGIEEQESAGSELPLSNPVETWDTLLVDDQEGGNVLGSHQDVDHGHDDGVA